MTPKQAIDRAKEIREQARQNIPREVFEQMMFADHLESAATHQLYAGAKEFDASGLDTFFSGAKAALDELDAEIKAGEQ